MKKTWIWIIFDKSVTIFLLAALMSGIGALIIAPAICFVAKLSGKVVVQFTFAAPVVFLVLLAVGTIQIICNALAVIKDVKQLAKQWAVEREDVAYAICNAHLRREKFLKWDRDSFCSFVKKARAKEEKIDRVVNRF